MITVKDLLDKVPERRKLEKESLYLQYDKGYNHARDTLLNTPISKDKILELVEVCKECEGELTYPDPEGNELPCPNCKGDGIRLKGER